MSVQTLDQQEQITPIQVAPVEPPPLNAGDRLSRVEFERRYKAHPEIKKAELIESKNPQIHTDACAQIKSKMIKILAKSVKICVHLWTTSDNVKSSNFN
jgi:hypothetical protein